MAIAGRIFFSDDSEWYRHDSPVTRHVKIGFLDMQQDFPFYIRIPESIPPSIALEKGGAYAAITSAVARLLIYLNTAGIKYELIATLCIKGKK